MDSEEKEIAKWYFRNLINKAKEKVKVRKILLLVSDNCPGCDVMKEIFRDEIERGEIQIVNVKTEEGRRIVEKLNIYTVPKLVVDYE